MFAPADDAFAARLRAAVPGLDLRPAEPRYLEEPRGLMRAESGLVARARNTGEVAALVRACAEARVAVVPFGGGTGLVGGQIGAGLVPLIVSLERMTALRGVWPEENVLVVEAGAVLADVQAVAAGAGRRLPLSLASQGSAQIGGLLATNAGGVNVLAHGNARALCLGVEAVLADGSVLHGLKRLRKDNMGYDLTGLLVGSEGTLGILTAAALRLVPEARPGVALLTVASPEAALALLALAQERFGPGLEAFELISGVGLDFLAETMPELRQPLPRSEWQVLVELALPEGLDPAEALAGLFETAVERGWASDGVIAQSAAQRTALWAMRESIPLANRRIGAISSHDVSLPLSELPGFIRDARAAIAAHCDARVNCFGHLGDGNLHYNCFPAPGRSRADYDRLCLKALVHEMVAERGGSVAAEHGVGRLKTEDLARFSDPAKLAAMRAIKRALDPKGILNPGVLF